MDLEKIKNIGLEIDKFDKYTKSNRELALNSLLNSIKKLIQKGYPIKEITKIYNDLIDSNYREEKDRKELKVSISYMANFIYNNKLKIRPKRNLIAIEDKIKIELSKSMKKDFSQDEINTVVELIIKEKDIIKSRFDKGYKNIENEEFDENYKIEIRNVIHKYINDKLKEKGYRAITSQIAKKVDKLLNKNKYEEEKN